MKNYATIADKKKIEDEDEAVLENEFDPEPYNYIFNKATSFIQGSFVVEDHF